MGKPTRSSTPEIPVGGQRVEHTRLSPQGPQVELLLEAEADRKRAFQAMAACFAASVRAFGGADALRLTLGKPEDYYNKILDGMNAKRAVQSHWWDPLLRDPRSAMIVLSYFSDVANAEPPVFHREISEEETARAALEVIAESGQLRETFRALIAKKCGARPEQVKL